MDRLSTPDLLELHAILRKYSEDEARDGGGRWTAGGGSASAGILAAATGTPPAYAKAAIATSIDKASAKAFFSVAPARGFDGLPTAVHSLKPGIARGDIPLVRGTRPEFAQQLKTGDYFAARGTFGTGIYTFQADDPTVRSYGGSGTTLKMSLSVDAKIADRKPGEDGRYTLAGDSSDKLYTSLASREPGLARSVATDDGLAAALLGYDAVRVVD